MASISLTDPVAATTVTAGLHAGNNAALRTAINGGLDSTNLAAGAVLNANVNAAAAIVQSKIAFDAWTAYTPTWSSAGAAPAILNGTLAGRYVQIGKTVIFVASMTAGNTTTFGSANAWTISLPVAALNATNVLGIARATQPGVASFQGEFIAPGTTTVNMYTISAVTGAMTTWDNTHPFAWANTHVFVLQGTYEAA